MTDQLPTVEAIKALVEEIIPKAIYEVRLEGGAATIRVMPFVESARPKRFANLSDIRASIEILATNYERRRARLTERG